MLTSNQQLRSVGMGLLYYGQNYLIYPSAFPPGSRTGTKGSHRGSCAELTILRRQTFQFQHNMGFRTKMLCLTPKTTSKYTRSGSFNESTFLTRRAWYLLL